MIFNKDPREKAGAQLQQEAFGEQQNSTRSTITKTAMSMVTFGVGMILAKGAVTAVSRGIGSLIAKGVKEGGFITKSLAGKAPGASTKFVDNMRRSIARIDRIATRRSRAVGQSGANQIIKSDYRIGNIIAHNDSFRSSKTGQFLKSARNADERYYGSTGKLFRPNKLDRTSKAPFTKSQMWRARGYKYMKESVYGAAVGLGLHAYQSRGDKSAGPWYSPGNLAAFATTFVAGDVVFRGAMPLAKKMIGAALGSAPGNAFQSATQRTAQNAMAGTLSALEKVNLNSLKAATRAIETVGSTIKASRGHNLDQKVGRVFKAMDMFRDHYKIHKDAIAKYSDELKSGEFVNRTIRSAISGLVGRQSAQRDTSPQALGGIEAGAPGSVVHTKGLRGGASTIYRDMLSDMSNERHAGKMASIINRLTGTSEARIGTVRVNATAPVNIIENGSVTKVRTGIESAGSVADDTFNLYKGKGVVEYHGKTYDLSQLYPSQMIGAAMEFLGATIKPFGHSATSLLNMSSLAKLGSHQEGYVKLRTGTNVNLSRRYGGPAMQDIIKNGESTDTDIMQLAIGDAFRALPKSNVNTKTSTDVSNYFNPENRKSWASEIIDFRTTRSGSPGNTGKAAHETAARLHHGEFIVGADENVHYVAGRLYLEQAGTTGSNFYAMGINTRSGEQLRYKSLPIIKGSTFATVHDRLMGGSSGSYQNNGEHQHYGYGLPERVERESHSVAQSFWREIRKSFDLGGKDTPTLPTKIINWFKGLNNPMEERNFFTQRAMTGFNIRSLDGASHKTLNEYGARVTGQSASMNSAAFSNLYSDADLLAATKKAMCESIEFASPVVKETAELLTTSSDILTGSADSIMSRSAALLGFVEKNKDNLGSQSKNAIIKVASLLSERVNGTSNDAHLGMFSTTTKLKSRSETLSVLDEANRALLNFAFRSADNSELSSLSSHLMSTAYSPHSNIIGNINLMKDTSAVSLGQFENLFKGTDDALTNEKKQAITQLMAMLGGNARQVENFTKHIRPIWRVGSNDTDYMTPQVSGIRSRLFIAEDIDVGGNKLVRKNSFHSPNSPSHDNLISQSQATDYDVVTVKNYVSGSSIDAVNNVANMVGLGFSGDTTRDWSSFAQNMLTKRIMPAMALMYGWRAADAIVDESGAFDNTGLSEGLNVFMATQFAKARLASSRILDASGFTDFAKSAEDLMPGSMNSPLMGAARGIGAPILGASIGMRFGNPFLGGAIGGIFGLLTAGGPLASIGAYDVTKSRGQLIEEYSGRKKVPYIQDRGWLVGSNPMAGSDVDGWVPSFYARLRSQYQYTPTTYGDKLQRMMEPIMPGSIEEKNMSSRPYPLTGGAFGRRPLTGNILAVGRQELYENELSEWGALPGLEISGISLSHVGDALEYNPTNTRHSSSVGNVLEGMDSNFIGGSTTLAQKPAISPGSVFGRTNEAFYRGTEFLGLRGFLLQASYKKLSGKTGSTAAPFGDMPQMADGSIMTSSSNWFWDQAIGDPLGMTEFIRRLYPPMSNDNKVNPLPNTQADWLPEKFQLGDPYREIALGEIRLPGSGFEAINDVELSMPGDIGLWTPDATEIAASYLFGKRETAVEYALTKYTKEKVASTLTQSNMDVQLDASYFNPNLDLSGTADVAAGGSVYKIKVLDDASFNSTNSVDPGMEGQLHMLGMISGNRTGTVVYVNKSTGESKTFNTSLNKDAALEAYNILEQGKATARSLLSNRELAPNFNLGNAYSRMDRLRILNDIAPESREFFDTFKQVEAINKYAKTEDYENNIENIQKMNFISKQPGKMYPYRFSNIGNNPEDIEYKNQIAAEYSLPERAIGAAWEKVSHMNSIMNKKFLNYNSPYESYARNEVFGRTIKLWDKPYDHFIKPYAAQVAGNRDVVDNSRSLATLGFVMGGPIGAAFGGMVGGATATYNSITSDHAKVPGYRNRGRDIDQVMDMVSYHKNEQRYYETGDPSFLNKQQQTMTYVNQHMNEVSLKDYERALPFSEKKYFEAMSMTQGSQERQNILNTLPLSVKPGMEKLWFNYDAPKGQQYVSDFGKSIMENQITPDWGGWYTGTDDKLMKIKMMNQHGLDARDIGVGWNSQMEQLSRTPLLEGKFESEFKTNVSDVQQSILSELQSSLGGRVTVNVSPSVGPSVTVTIVSG